MRVIITGCNGKLGRATARALVDRGDTVVGIDRTPRPDAPHKVVIGTLTDPFLIHRAIDALEHTPDALIHLANHANALAPNDPETVLRENLAMNTSVFHAAQQRGAHRVVFTSSIQAMLGGSEHDGSWSERLPHQLPISEHIPLRPTNHYGLSKVLAETTLNHLCDPTRFSPTLAAVSLRFPFVLSGKGFDRAASNTHVPDFRWGGSECFAYIALEDATDAITRALDADTQGHQILWAAAPDPRARVPVAELAQRFYADVPGVEEAIRRDSFVDCERARQILGWTPRRIIREAQTA